MEQISVHGSQAFLTALRNRNRNFLELRERHAESGGKSRCAFSRQGRCAVPESGHSCLDSVRKRFSESARRVGKYRKTEPGLFESEEAKAFERSFREQKAFGASAAKTP